MTESVREQAEQLGVKMTDPGAKLRLDWKEHVISALEAAEARGRSRIVGRLEAPDDELVDAIKATGCVSPPNIMAILPICRVLAARLRSK